MELETFRYMGTPSSTVKFLVHKVTLSKTQSNTMFLIREIVF